MEKKSKIFFCLILLSLLVSCRSLEQEVDLNLPPFESQLVVECYLEKDTFVRVSVSETQDYYAPPLKSPFVSGATVTLTYDGVTEMLEPNPDPDMANLKYFNYVLPKKINLKEGTRYLLEVKDQQGRTATASTQWLAPVKMDSVQYYFREDSMAYIVANFTDYGSTKDFYRFRVRNLSDTSDNSRRQDKRDFAFDDVIFNGQPIAQGTGYRFRKGDMVEVYLYHITEDFHDFITTMRAAESANGNPLAQPAVIKSNIIGGIGIFTTLSYDKKTIRLK